MKKFDIASILFGLLLSVIALYFMLRPSTATSAPVSTIPVVQVGDVVQITTSKGDRFQLKVVV